MTSDNTPERGQDWRDIRRRSILKTIGAGALLGGMAGTATAQPVFSADDIQFLDCRTAQVCNFIEGQGAEPNKYKAWVYVVDENGNTPPGSGGGNRKVETLTNNFENAWFTWTVNNGCATAVAKSPYGLSKIIVRQGQPVDDTFESYPQKDNPFICFSANDIEFFNCRRARVCNFEEGQGVEPNFYKAWVYVVDENGAPQNGGGNRKVETLTNDFENAWFTWTVDNGCADVVAKLPNQIEKIIVRQGEPVDDTLESYPQKENPFTCFDEDDVEFLDCQKARVCNLRDDPFSNSHARVFIYDSTNTTQLNPDRADSRVEDLLSPTSNDFFEWKVDPQNDNCWLVCAKEDYVLNRLSLDQDEERFVFRNPNECPPPEEKCRELSSETGSGEVDEHFTVAPDDVWKARHRGETNGRLFLGPDGEPDGKPTAVDLAGPEDTWLRARVWYYGDGTARMDIRDDATGALIERIFNDEIPTGKIDGEACELGFTIAAAARGETNLKNVRFKDGDRFPSWTAPPTDDLTVEGSRRRTRKKYLLIKCPDPTKAFEVKFLFRYKKFGRGNDRYPYVRLDIPGYPEA